VIQDAQGNFYGTTQNGGNNACQRGCGTVFKLSKTGKETVLYSFTSGADGEGPFVPVIRDAKGNLYGTTQFGGAFAAGGLFKLSRTGKMTVLYSFTGGKDGKWPYAGLTQDAKGNLYGTTGFGGDLKCINFGISGCGVVYKLDPAGKETVLYTFTGGADGANPFAGVIQDAQGNLYGTTSYGGIGCNSLGCGTVFRLSKTGKETVLYSFGSQSGDGAFPQAGVIRDAKGNFYGTAAGGGTYDVGTVFKLSKTGKETTLHSFTAGVDGANPVVGVIQDAKANLYGTTNSGGDLACGEGNNGCGTVFKLSRTGKMTVLYGFTGATNDGAYPYAGVIQDAKGNLYGTTIGGGLLASERCSS
jgi:uncharacterized repeat protein (TIGR03803 family)